MRRTRDEIDQLVEDVIVDAYGEDEQLGAFVTVIGDHLPLRGVLAQDQRCIDAHGHIGNIMFDRDPAAALVHYQTGVALGELALPFAYTGVLLWGLLGNRPFLRCLHGMGLCLWRLGRREEAESVFHTMLWLNPSDQQGERFNYRSVRDELAWKDHRN